MEDYRVKTVVSKMSKSITMVEEITSWVISLRIGVSVREPMVANDRRDYSKDSLGGSGQVLGICAPFHARKQKPKVMLN